MSSNKTVLTINTCENTCRRGNWQYGVESNARQKQIMIMRWLKGHYKTLIDFSEENVLTTFPFAHVHQKGEKISTTTWIGNASLFKHNVQLIDFLSGTLIEFSKGLKISRMSFPLLGYLPGEKNSENFIS